MEHCSQLETITVLKTSHTHMVEIIDEMKGDLKNIRLDLKLFLDTANKLYSTKQDNQSLRELLEVKHKENKEDIQTIYKWGGWIISLIIGGFVAGLIKVVIT